MEVLHLEYEASGPSIKVRVDEVVERTIGEKQVMVPIAGRVIERHFPLTQLAVLDAKLARDLQSVLARLDSLTRAKAQADVANPEQLREEANRVARERQALERERAELVAMKEKEKTT